MHAFIHPSMHAFINPSMHSFIHASIYPSIHPCIYLSIHACMQTSIQPRTTHHQIVKHHWPNQVRSPYSITCAWQQTAASVTCYRVTLACLTSSLHPTVSKSSAGMLGSGPNASRRPGLDVQVSVHFTSTSATAQSDSDQTPESLLPTSSKAASVFQWKRLKRAKNERSSLFSVCLSSPVAVGTCTLGFGVLLLVVWSVWVGVACGLLALPYKPLHPAWIARTSEWDSARGSVCVCACARPGHTERRRRDVCAQRRAQNRKERLHALSLTDSERYIITPDSPH